MKDIFLDFLRWDESDEAAMNKANASAVDDRSSGATRLPGGGRTLVQRKRKPTRRSCWRKSCE